MLSEGFAELTCPYSGLWQLDIKDLDLGYCEELNMDSTLEMIALNFKNIETLNIAETNVTVLAEGHWNVALTECLLRGSESHVR